VSAIGAVLLDLYDTLAWTEWPTMRAELEERFGIGETDLMRAFTTTRKARSTGEYGSEEGDLRAILEAAGVGDVLAKSLGSANAINVSRATIAGLQGLYRPDEVAKLRGKSPEEVSTAGMLRAYRERSAPKTEVNEVA